MLSELSACAHRLGVGFGEAAEGAGDWARKLEYFQLFDRCFFAVRVATALELRLARTPAQAPASASDATGGEREDLRDRSDAERFAPETDRGRAGADREEPDRDREREAEPVSLPVLLRTLEGVAADAAALPGPKPAALPTLRELLAHVETGSAPSPIAASRPGLRARLAGSATTLTLDLAPRPAGPALATAARRATGPPPRR